MIKEILTIISGTAEQIGASKPYICGGLPRDKVMNELSNISDLDITNGDETIHILAKNVASKLKAPLKVMDDGHGQISLRDIKIDFSSNYIQPGIQKILSAMGKTNPTKMELEIYSRDFTCNALLLDTNLSKIIDLTNLGVKDINDKIIKTCLHPSITLGSDPKRIVRVIYLAAKLGFNVDDSVSGWIKQNAKLIAVPSNQYTIKKIHKALDYNKEMTLKLMDEFGLWKYIPMSDRITDLMTRDVGRI